MKRKILLVDVDYPGSFQARDLGWNIGLGYISEVLIQNSIEHTILELKVVNNREESLLFAIEEYRPDIVGFSMMSYSYKLYYELINKCKKKYPGIIYVIGGPHATTFKEMIFEDCNGLDIVVVGEGEIPTLELCNGEELKDIKGIIYKENGKIFHNERNDWLNNLDSIPFPHFTKFQSKKDRTDRAILSSRGCPYDCFFCPVSTTIGKKWRYRSAKNVVNEIEYWVKEKGTSYFEVHDDGFTTNRKRVIEICDDIIERGLNKHIKISISNGIRADRTDIELLKKMKSAGFYLIAFGVESGNQRVLSIIKKGEKLPQIEKAIKNACELGFLVRLTFVIGTPGETERDILDSIAFAKKYPVMWVNFYHLIPFPGSKLYQWILNNNNFIYEAPSFLNNCSHWFNKPLFKTKEISIEKRIELFEKANKEMIGHCLPNLERYVNQSNKEGFKMDLEKLKKSYFYHGS
jgi:radical SAM superfamily enzyme YgiQ (UPF0313 family)